MSQLFDNYRQRKISTVPDNSHGFIDLKPDYDEVIVLGAGNTHCMTIPHGKDDIRSFDIVYNQGIETKLIKSWYNLELCDDCPENFTEIYWDNDYEIKSLSKLYDELMEEYKEAIEKHAKQAEIIGLKRELDEVYERLFKLKNNSAISYDILAEETEAFNNHNGEIRAQAFVNLIDGQKDASDIYKIKLVHKLNILQEDKPDGR